ncbi:MAG: TOBE domain-containing protein [Hyphomicrobiales bacterium]|nr:TOBE domain-containing protein [Hyphomicrobiales bacterium]
MGTAEEIFGLGSRATIASIDSTGSQALVALTTSGGSVTAALAQDTVADLDLASSAEVWCLMKSVGRSCACVARRGGLNHFRRGDWDTIARSKLCSYIVAKEEFPDGDRYCCPRPDRSGNKGAGRQGTREDGLVSL